MATETWRKKIGTRTHWTEEDGAAAVAAWKASGEMLTAFARRHALHPQRLAWWRDRQAAVAAPTATLVPMTVRATNRTGVPAVLTIGVVRVETIDVEQVSPAWIAAVARALTEVGA